jgi:dTDP-4-amino-4,6-dideoxygalactose transaminase
MIQYGRHSVDEQDIKAVVSSLQSDWLTTGPLVKEFETQLEEIVGAPVVTVTSGTAALHASYAAIDLKPGDEIITPPITFIATQATAALLGAKIKFADILSDTATIDPEKVELAVTEKTKAIVAVDFAGHPAEMNELREIADRYNIYLIEDAAHSIGSQYRGRKVGSIADLTTFSFFPTKNMTTGEGGAISSQNVALLEKARKFSRQGIERDSSKYALDADGPWHYEVSEFGLNYRLPDILCSLGISQSKKLDQFKRRRIEIFSNYNSRLSSIGWIELPVCRQYVSPNWHLYPIRVPKEIRRELFMYLHSNGIGAQVNYIPAYRHPVFQIPPSRYSEFPNSESFYKSEISLPMHIELSEQDQEKICTLIEAFPFNS